MSLDMTLQLEPRLAGPRSLSSARQSGKVPGVMLGTHNQSSPIQVPLRTLEAALSQGAEHHPFTVKLGTGGQGRLAVIKAIQRDLFTRVPVHIDLFVVDAGEKVTMDVPIHILGEQAVARKGLQVHLQLHSLSVEGPATSLPESIDIAVSHLGAGETVLVSSITPPPGTTIHDHGNLVIFSIGHMRKPVEAEVAEAKRVTSPGPAPAPEQAKPAE